MKEKKRKEQQATPGGDGGIFDSAPAATPQNVAVSSGPYAEDLPVAGMPVGEIRKRFAAQLDIAPGAQAIVDGNAVGDDYSMKAGEALTFIQHAGEKGNYVVVEGDKAKVVEQSGKEMNSMPIPKLVERMLPGPNTGDVVLPHGVRAVLSQGNMTVLAWEKPPHIAQLGWIAKDSPKPYGPGTKYRKVRIALPYLVILSPFIQNRGMPELMCKDECFFRTEPLKSLNDELSYPGLLNCSKFPGSPQTNRSPLSWICTQHLKPNPGMGSCDPGERMRASFEAVRYCLLETSFNLSSEHHEGNSWYGESKKIDPRIATIEDWEEATRKDPLFVLEVPWIRTGHSVKQAAGRMFKHAGAADNSVKTADDLARIIFNG